MANLADEDAAAAAPADANADANADAGLPEDLLISLEFLDDEDAAADSAGNLLGDIDTALESPSAAAVPNGGGTSNETNKTNEAPSSVTLTSKTNSSPPTQQQYVRFSEIGPHDVLLGRGQRSYDAKGTVLFRRLVAERKEEYLAATKVKKKNEIAMGLVDHVRNKLDPPGRFLRLASDQPRGAGTAASSKEDEQLWCLADDKQCLEKAKMTLRQKENKDSSKRDQKATAEMAAVAAAAASGIGMDVAGGIIRASKKGKAAGARGGGRSKRGRNRSGSDEASSSGMSTSSNGSSVSALSLGSRTPSGASLSMALPVELPQQQQQQQQHHLHQPASILSWRQQSNQLGPIQELAAMSVATANTSSMMSPTTQDQKGLDQMIKLQRSLALANQFRRSGGTDLVMLGSILFQNLTGFGHGELGLRGASTISTGAVADVDTYNSKAVGNNAAGAGAPVEEETDHPHRGHPQQQRQQQKGDAYSVLLDRDVPPSLCAVVASLVDNNIEHRIHYSAVAQVEQDIQCMVETPRQYFYGGSLDGGGEGFSGAMAGQLDLGVGVGGNMRLHGRDGHLLAMTQVIERVLLGRHRGMIPDVSSGNAREVIALSGYSGTGKTALVDRMRDPVAKMGGSFVSGKFDEAKHANPLSVVFGAFDEFCGDLLRNGSDWATSLKIDVINALQGRGSSSLASTLPNLGTILGTTSSANSPGTNHYPEVGGLGGIESLNQFIFYFRCFIRSLATPNHPLLLVLDDCQWADSAALEFISLLCSDDEMSSILAILVFRDNEVGMDHPLRIELNKMSSLGVKVNSIEVQNLQRGEVTNFLADVLHLLPRQVTTLATSIYTKTDGNPLFVVQFIKSLVDEGVLQYSLSARRWKWDLAAIDSKELRENVVGLMVKKMLSLDLKVQSLLKFLACLGYRSDERIVKTFASMVGPECLQVLLEEGLMTKVTGPSTSYKFAHDKVQQAAYSLIPQSDRITTHLHIGRHLRDSLESTQNFHSDTSLDPKSNAIIFAAVDQLSRGAELITARDEKVEFAHLCCNAGGRALAASAFRTAAIYFLQGSAMLNETDWVANYDLILNLFTKCAYAQYVTGNYQGVQITLDPVLTNGRSLQDKFDAYCIMLNTLGAQGRQKDTLNFGLDILSSFGENFPRDPKPEDVMAEYVRLKGALAQRSIDGIKNAPALEDKSKVALMKLFVTINRYAFQANQNLMSLIIFRAANVVLAGGVCREASVVFSSLGYIFLVFGNASQGYEYAKLGLALLNRFRNKEYCARVYCVAYGLVFPSAEPFQANIQKLKEGYEEGMRAGDVEWSMILADLYARTALMCGGGDLMSLAEEIRTFVKRMKELSHHMQTMTLPCLQTALNLMDASVEYPNVLSGEAMDEDVLLNKALENQRMNVVAIVYFFKLFLSYLFGEHNDAAEMAQKCQSLRKSRPFRGGNEAIETFYSGLVAAEMIRLESDEDQREFWREMAVQSLKSMENWASLCPWNFSAKLSIMKAEIAFADDKVSAAAEAYRVAIELAREHRFVLEEALANERAGIFFSSSRGISFDTTSNAVDQHYLRAQTLYAAMGAIRKAKHVENARMVG